MEGADGRRVGDGWRLVTGGGWVADWAEVADGGWVADGRRLLTGGGWAADGRQVADGLEGG